MVADHPFVISREYQQVIFAVRDGILRWLDRPGNELYYLDFAACTAAEMLEHDTVYVLFVAMDAVNWLVNGSFGLDADPEQLTDLWEEAIYQVAAVLCIPDINDR